MFIWTRILLMHFRLTMLMVNTLSGILVITHQFVFIQIEKVID